MEVLFLIRPQGGCEGGTGESERRAGHYFHTQRARRREEVATVSKRFPTDMSVLWTAQAHNAEAKSELYLHECAPSAEHSEMLGRLSGFLGLYKRCHQHQIWSLLEPYQFPRSHFY